MVGGENYFAIKDYQKKILERYQALSNFQLNFITLDAEEAKPTEIVQAVLTQPFLISHRLVWLKNLFQAEAKEREQVWQALKNVPQTTVVVLVEQGPLPKSIPTLPGLVKKEFKKPTEKELFLLVAKLFRQQKLEITNEAIAAVIAFSEKDQRQLEKNIFLASLWARANKLPRSKLRIPTGKFVFNRFSSSRQASRYSTSENKTVQIDTSLLRQIFQKEPKEEVFRLLDKALNKEAATSYQNLLKQGFDLNHLFYLLLYQLRLAILAAIPEGFRHLPTPPFQAAQARRLSSKRPLNFWRRLYRLFLDLDFQLKTGKMEARGAVETFLLALSKEGK